MKKLEIDIFGSTYTVMIGEREELDISYENVGECNVYEKVIKICTTVDDKVFSPSMKDKYMMEVIKHEISHAMLYESGLVDLGLEELLPNWLSVNVDKLVERSALVFREFDKESN